MKKLAVNGRKVFAVILAGTILLVSGVKKHSNGDDSSNRIYRPIYTEGKDDYQPYERKEEPAILPEEPNYEVVLEKKKRRKNGKWVA